jgi:hypothetical protein
MKTPSKLIAENRNNPSVNLDLLRESMAIAKKRRALGISDPKKPKATGWPLLRRLMPFSPEENTP